MDFMNTERAEILIQALPYIQKFKDKTIVVKYGGHAMVNEELKQAVIHDLILLSYVGIKVVVIHGGGMEINQFLKKTGKESKFVQGQRFTDAETMDIVQMVLCGKVNKEIVSLVERNGGKAVGLCGLDGKMLEAEKLMLDGEDIGYVGSITKVNAQIIHDSLDKKYIPIIATVATGMKDGKPYNINADIAAAKIAAELGVTLNVLSRWRREWTMDKKDNPVKNEGPDKSIRQLEQENKRLQKKLDRAELELDILKKLEEYAIKRTQ